MDFPFLFLNVTELFEEARNVLWAFQFALRDGSELASRFFTFIEAMRCSLAFLEAFVSRANRGVESGVLGAIMGVGDCDVSPRGTML